MAAYRYQVLGPLFPEGRGKALLGLAIADGRRARPVVFVPLPEAAEQDPELRERVRRETEHVARLEHPHLVAVLGFTALDRGHARVVEFADGESLASILAAGGALPLSLAARVVADACTGVHYAHVAGNDDGSPLVHGDLRPRTLLVGFNGVTRVTGYGALAFAGPPGSAGASTAPEQVTGGRGSTSPATDVYLLGLVLFECLTGRVPFSKLGEVFERAVLNDPFPVAPQGTIPPALEAVIRRACARRPEDRLATPLALREAIEAALEGPPAGPEDLARHLEQLFPRSQQLRADRRHTIDAGIADFARSLWAEPPDEAPAPAPASQPSVSPDPGSALPPRVVVGGRPVEAVRLVEPAPEPVVPDEVPEPERATTLPWLVGLALFVTLIGLFWAWSTRTLAGPAPRRVPTPGVVARPERPSAPVLPRAIDAGAAPHALATSEGGGAEGRAGSIVATAPPAELARVGSSLGTTSPGALATHDGGAQLRVGLSVTTTPPVDLLADGAPLGRTPWSGTLPAGRRVLTLERRDLGILASRVVVLRDEPLSEEVVFGQGMVAITAPVGAVVFLDGVRVGVAPLPGEVPAYEGQHRILVTVGASRWTESFSLLARQRVSFNVHLE